MGSRILLLLSFISCVLCDLRWQLLHPGTAEDAPSPRTEAAIGYDNLRNLVIVFGGLPGPSHDTWIFNMSTGVWKDIQTSNHPPRLYGAVSGVTRDYFFVATGQGLDSEYYHDIWGFNLVRLAWERLPVQPKPHYMSIKQWVRSSHHFLKPAGRYGAGGGVAPGGTKFFVSQGFSTDAYFDTFTYDIESLGWYREHCDTCNPYNPNYPHARYLHGSTVISDHELVVFGGCLSGGGTGGPCPSLDSWLFDNKRKTWRQLDDCATPRMNAKMASLPPTAGRRRVVLLGGQEETDQVLHVIKSDPDVVAVLDPDSGKWTQREVTALMDTGENLLWFTSMVEDSSVGSPGKRASAAVTSGRYGVFLFGGLDLKRGTLQSDLWLLKGNALDADRSPKVSCSGSFNFVNMITVHGILMFVSWAVLMHWGAFIARYLRFKTSYWFYLHLFLEILGLCLATAGMVFGILSVQSDHFQFTHGIIGLVTMIIGVLQPMNAILRPPKLPEHCLEKSTRRRLWEFVHHFGGRLALILAFINISLGVFLAVTHTLIWALWFAYLALIVGVYLLAECCRSLQGRKRVDPLSDVQDFINIEKSKYNISEARKDPPVDYATNESQSAGL